LSQQESEGTLRRFEFIVEEVNGSNEPRREPHLSKYVDILLILVISSCSRVAIGIFMLSVISLTTVVALLS
jgi:hypothetical protein